MNDIAFIDLKAQQAFLGNRINEAIERVLAHGHYIMGPEIKKLEEQLSEFAGAERVVSCSNGTDALQLPLMAWDIGPGDAVFVPSFTFASTAEVVALVGATPVFVEVLPDTFNMDPKRLLAAIEEIEAVGKLTPRAVIAVDLFGQIADYPALKKITSAKGVKLIADAAQGLGSTREGKQAAHWADVTTTSFFPAKPLGCYGDGGAVITNDHGLADIIESLRVHGKGIDKYDNVRIGMNGRLDTVQAAILMEKLAIFPQEIEKRNHIAARYTHALHNTVTTPFVPDGVISTWAQYTILVSDRGKVQENLKQAGIPTAVYYPKPLHQQTAYNNYPVGNQKLEISDDLANNVLSLPMHPYLEDDVIDYIAGEVLEAIGLGKE
ncbi:DegT/DnrJ/EryC1/StrS aminotransferase [hydrothermal vent metagenome]|uniref:DegT/DnrJ/EryC1/StrS aminotransferase n=1 Tax=hydrothermal vent metagenome TaxID=652676 RepID=A0A3B0S8V5_9ZZZZ